MSRIRSFVMFVLIASGLCEVSHAQFVDPIYGFPFGYTLGAQAAFRNRLPAPPYFAIYPPVYYGKRYARPYGESPYASFPLLGQVPGYAPVPAESSGYVPTTIQNPHAPCCSEREEGSSDSEPKVKIVAQNRRGSVRTIVNPYAQEQVATKD